MLWQHEVSVEWLTARQQYLTATDIVKLLPQAKKFQGKAGLPPAFVGTWFEKHTKQVPNPVSYDAAARGHIMEPYALLDYNAQGNDDLHHWDDCVIHQGHLAFSPDAMDVPQIFENGELPVDIRWDHPKLKEVTAIAEIKSYQPFHHGQCVVLPKDKQEELMQIAVPFRVLPNLAVAYLIHYCPGAPVSMRVDVYDRDDLQRLGYFDSIDMVLQKWVEVVRELKKLKSDYHATYTEQEINEMAMKGFC